MAVDLKDGGTARHSGEEVVTCITYQRSKLATCGICGKVAAAVKA